MEFPLGDWIDDHAGLPYSMGASGMRGSLESTVRILEGPRRSPPDVPALVRLLAERIGVAPGQVYLTHGATEANALVAFYLAGRLRTEVGRAPRARVAAPEYPPLGEVVGFAGFRAVRAGDADLWVRSEPHNPTGRRSTPEERLLLSEGCPLALVDETFREFTTAPSVAAEGRPGTWATGTFSKTFGADAIRVGWIVVPPEEAVAYGRFHPLVSDKLSKESVRAALDLIASAEEILAESRGLFDTNRAVLERRLPFIGPLQGPVAFDRPGGSDTEPLVARCLAAGVLVCPGRFFGDPSGVRLGLTRRSFPESLSAYLRVRGGTEEASSVTRSGRPAARPRPRAGRTAGARSGRSARTGPARPVP